MSLIIETDRLILRRFRETDLEEILEFSRTADWWLERILPWETDRKSIADYWEKAKYMDPYKDPKWFDLIIELKSPGRIKLIIGNKQAAFFHGIVDVIFGIFKVVIYLSIKKDMYVDCSQDKIVWKGDNG